MKGLLIPAALLLPLTAMVVLWGGLQGAGMAALLGAFLVGFSLLLFRGATRSSAFPGGGRTRSPGAESDSQFLGYVVLGGLFVRVVLALALRQTGMNQVVAPDEFTFHDNGVYFLEWLQGERLQPFSYRWMGRTQVGYFVVVGMCYRLFGVHEIVPILLNCLIGAACGFPAYKIAARVGGRRAGQFAAALVVFFPSLVLWSTLLIRDSLALWLILWGSCRAQELMRRFTVRGALMFVLCLALLATLRGYLFFLLTAGTLLAFVVSSVQRPGRAAAAAAVGAAGVLVLVQGLGLGTEVLGEASLTRLAEQRRWNAAQGESAIALEGHDLSSIEGAVSYLPVGLVYFLFSPFPWKLGGRQTPAIPDVMLWYLLFPFFLRGVLHGVRRRRRAALVPLMVALQVAFFYALVEGNVGIIFRHRAQFLVLALPFSAVALAQFRRTAKRAVPQWTPARLTRGV